MEVLGRAVFSRGITTDARPRKYYTIPKDTVESVLEDMEQLVDFFLIEFQRILFVENLTYTIGAFFAALVTYSLVRFLPLWGLTLLGVTVAYMGPLIYINNKEFIDEQINALQDIINAQTVHVKEMAETRTAHATEVVRHYVNDYRARAHDYVVSTRARHATPEAERRLAKPEELAGLQPERGREPGTGLQHADFPAAPQTDIVPEVRAATPITEVKREETRTPPIAAL
ncbi:hypothetical protein VTO42DRAFT_5795 [Malbranchea cinnamomea]